MKKLTMLAVALMLLPGALFAGDIIRDGDPGFFWGLYTTADVIKGENYCDDVAATNFGFLSTSLCQAEDTFCLHYEDLLGWTLTTDFAEGEAFIVGAGSYYVAGICVQVPCDATIGQTNTVTVRMSFIDVDGVCQPDSADCVDPNVYSGANKYDISSVVLTVVESPPALYILQDSLYYVEQGAVAAYIPFSICNGDPCAPATVYGYNIQSTGVVGAAIDVTDVTGGVLGGECEQVYGIIDAGAANVCDYDELTIIAWDDETGTVYDTCVQLIHVIEPVPVPLFTTPVVTILVLAMILAAAVIMKRTAVSKA
jgi:hypothetical protein